MEYLVMSTVVFKARASRLRGETAEDAYYRQHAPAHRFAALIASAEEAIDAVRNRFSGRRLGQATAGAECAGADRPFNGLAGSQA